jgi:hypothetical protein
LLLSVETGMNFAAMLYRQRLGQAIGDHSNVAPYARRYYFIDTWQDIRAAVPELKSGKLPVRDFLRPYLANHVSASVSWSDPQPLFRRLLNRKS